MSRLRARVAPYKEAIAKARAAGATWGDIGKLLGAGDRQVRLAVKHCRYEATQIPLPEPQTAQPQAPFRTQPSAASGARADIESVINQHLIK